MANKAKKNQNQDHLATNVMNLNNGETVEVLYQRLGDRWYAFSAVGDEVYVGSVDEALEQAPEQKREMPAA
jgi:hypothetical protein